MIRKMIGSIVIYGAVFYCIILSWPSIDFTPYVVYPAQSLNTLSVFFLVWSVMRFIYEVIRKVLKILSLPVWLITFGLSNTIINIWVLYAVPVVLNSLQSQFIVTVWSFIEVLMLSILLAILGIITRYL
jgi:uncharacterized membrane protein YvlD (DUF360 family)